VAAGIRRVASDADLMLLPVADGGDGTVDAALAAGYTRMTVDAVGPTGEPVAAVYALDGSRAVVELASVVGLSRLPDGIRRPLDASTFGFGSVVAAAIDAGATQIVLAVGGSASTDGGAGMVEALGARVHTSAGEAPVRGGRGLRHVRSIELEQLRKRIDGVSFVVAGDVANPLLGDRGAAAVFGPQKGADPAEVSLLEAGLEQWAAVVGEAVGTDFASLPGSGAAGGTAFAAVALLDAELASGIDLVLGLVDIGGALVDADLVVTGEGSIDEQTLAGKAPLGVAAAARERGIPVVAVAGRCLVDPRRLAAAGIRRVYVVSEIEPDHDRSMANAARLLELIGRQIAREWLT
jgi:glycerate kinase